MTKKKWIIVAVLALLPWLAVAGCSKKPTVKEIVPAPYTVTKTDTKAAPVKKTIAKPVVKHKQRAAPVKDDCQPLDAICHLLRQ